MDLSVVEADLESWIETISGLPMEWGRLPHKRHNGPFILVYPLAFRPLGHDEKLYTYQPGPDSLKLDMIGVRHLVLNLSFRAFDQRMNLGARKWAEEFRIAIQRPDSIDQLVAANIALVRDEALIDTNYEYQRRFISQVDMELTMALRYCTEDPVFGGEYINEVVTQTECYVIDEYGCPVIDREGRYVTTEAD